MSNAIDSSLESNPSRRMYIVQPARGTARPCRCRDGSRVGFFGSGSGRVGFGPGSGLTFIREIGLNRGHTS